MQFRNYIELPDASGNSFYYHPEQLTPIKEEIEEFLTLSPEISDLHLAKKVLFSHEIQSNNQVEGYGYDVSLIEDVIKRKTQRVKSEVVKRRIENLYRGYQYILRHRKIDEEHLRELYQILSKDLIEYRDLIRMGEYYRTDTVYILRNGRLDDSAIDEGVLWTQIPYLIGKYFEFLHSLSFNESMTDEYIKSQIMHFYFVFIHPYFDANGRTSRTMALWYLLNKKDYPFIIFNRGISFAGAKYGKLIADAKDTKNLTKFLNFMLETVKLEMEKETVMQTIANNCNHRLNGVDYQTLLYFLSMKRNKTVTDFASFYNQKNEKKRVFEIYKEMILPLIEMDILEVVGYSKKMYSPDLNNMFLELNPQIVPKEEDMQLKRLKVFQSSKK